MNRHVFHNQFFLHRIEKLLKNYEKTSNIRRRIRISPQRISCFHYNIKILIWIRHFHELFILMIYTFCARQREFRTFYYKDKIYYFSAVFTCLKMNNL